MKAPQKPCLRCGTAHWSRDCPAGPAVDRLASDPLKPSGRQDIVPQEMLARNRNSAQSGYAMPELVTRIEKLEARVALLEAGKPKGRKPKPDGKRADPAAYMRGYRQRSKEAKGGKRNAAKESA